MRGSGFGAAVITGFARDCPVSANRNMDVQ